ncbi:hypothetical protein K3181_10085 [Qipengyuania sp. YG27]|uniref:DUF4398 domain-containing protein n=1 Tax=Qipengyuania mesophila TaxID=2867246 RepID=A0ABS7JVV8_9SPHN|nr:hypothetical protein [Qipengyuania mesophila]MBX7501788.1 hypothetical protein [Qipengyuania mesophila]
MNFRKLPVLTITAILLAGCATTADDRYPSLATRDVERAEGTFEPVETEELDVPPVEVNQGTNLAERLDALVAQAREAHAGFLDAVPTAESRVKAAAGSSVGSDGWAAAQVALADLDSARSNAAIALGDLDILFTAATVQADDATAIVAARDSVIALVAEEDAVLERLRAQVR